MAGPSCRAETCCATFTKSSSRSRETQIDVTASLSGKQGNALCECTSKTLRLLSESTTRSRDPSLVAARSWMRQLSSQRCSSVPSISHSRIHLSKPAVTKRVLSGSQAAAETGSVCLDNTKAVSAPGSVQIRTVQSEAERRLSLGLQAKTLQASSCTSTSETAKKAPSARSQMTMLSSLEEDASSRPSCETEANQTSSLWWSSLATQCVGSGGGE
mmetsp:Transcript_6612/g.15568  ORF Transcript_6612/g.15568 Transcript_6612/m.15568 type:complete len:215 (+) Transcript_6612:519-1163(+)